MVVGLQFRCNVGPRFEYANENESCSSFDFDFHPGNENESQSPPVPPNVQGGVGCLPTPKYPPAF